MSKGTLRHRLLSYWGLIAILPLASAAPPRSTPPAWGPDQVGGYASDSLLVQVLPGVMPGQLAGGRLTLITSDRSGDADAAEAALADLLAASGVTAIAPAIADPLSNAALAAELGLDRYYLVHVPAGSDTPALAAQLAAFETHVAAAELNHVVGALVTPNDPSFGQQYGLHNTGQNINGQTGTPDADIDAPEAWNLHTGTSSIIIAIIDTGVSQSHPEFSGKLVPGYNFSGDGGPTDTDDGWLISHGTHCAGIASAKTNNAQGIAGVSWGARIMPVKVLNWLGTGTDTGCANGITWAADHGAHVLSMSWGSTAASSLIQSAVAYAWGQGKVLVAASGNVASDPISYPAAYPQCIAVGATDNRDILSDFTSFGPQMDVVAPGVDVYSTWDTFFNPDTYTFESGTSMACPHVSGLAALVWSAKPTATNAEVRQFIENNCDDKGPAGWDQQYGWGRINAFRAVQAALTPQWQDGDLNCDGVVNFDDINPFVLALTDPAGYAAAFPNCDLLNGDINGDGVVTFDDINGFVALLGG